MSDTTPAPEPANTDGEARALPTEGGIPQVLDDIKNRLEVVIAGKTVNLTLHGTHLTLKKWGLRSQLQAGAKVIRLVERVRAILPSNPEVLLQDPGVMSQMLAFAADDIISIVALSLSSPFRTVGEAEDWLDENADLSDLFDLGFLVYDMNLKDGGLGKLFGGMAKAGQKVASLSMSSSKS